MQCYSTLRFTYSRFALNVYDLMGYMATTLENEMDKKSSRQRIRRFQVLLLPTEAVAIKSHAANCGVSVSAYLRELGLHYKPKTILDYKAAIQLAKVNGDLGRLGGLLKMWLTNDERLTFLGKEQGVVRINGLLDEIQSTQCLLLELVKKV